jgi:hypothetical protein
MRVLFLATITPNLILAYAGTKDSSMSEIRISTDSIFRSERGENVRKARNGDPLAHRACCVSRIDLEVVS